MTRWAVTRSTSANGGQGGPRGRVRMSPPPDLVAAPGYGARRLYQAYLAAWNRHVDAVLTGPQFAVLSAIRAYPDADQTALAGAVALDTSTMADVCRRMERRGLITRTARAARRAGEGPHAHRGRRRGPRRDQPPRPRPRRGPAGRAALPSSARRSRRCSTTSGSSGSASPSATRSEGSAQSNTPGSHGRNRLLPPAPESVTGSFRDRAQVLRPRIVRARIEPERT